MVDIAQLGFDIDSSQARTAARDLDKLAAAADKAEQGARDLGAASRNLLRNEKGQFINAATSAAKYGAEIDALRTKYNPLYAASKQFEASQNEIKRALELGAISVGQAEAALERLNAQMVTTASTSQTMVAANNRMSASMSSANMQTANVFAQLNDIGVMMASGQNPFILAIQQGTQLNQVWAGMGSSGRSLTGVFGVLRGAFASMVNPMSLLTIGVIAGGAALVQWGVSAIGAGEDTKTMRERVDELEGSLARVNEIANIYSAEGLEQMRAKYGEINSELLMMIERQRQFAADKAMTDARNAIAGLRSEYGLVLDNIERSRVMFDDVNNSLGLTKSQAIELKNAIRDASTADNFDDQAEALGRVNALLSISKARSTEVAGATLDAEDAMRQLAASAPKADWLNSAINQAWEVGRALWDAVSASAALANQPKMNTGSLDWAKNDLGFMLPGNELLNIPEPKKTRGGKGGGGGGAAAAAENAFERLKISLEKESQFQIEKYEKDQAVLQEALKKKLTTQQEYEELTALLKTEYWGSEYEKEVARREIEQSALDEALEKKYLSQEQYNQRVAELQSQEMAMTLGHYNTLFGNMASIAQAGGDKATGVVKAFSIAQGLINSYLAYTQVLADPSLVGRPFLRTALAASTLAAGLAQVANMKSGGGGSGGAKATSSATSSATAQPTRTTRIELVGDDWVTSLVRDKIGPALYEYTKDGGQVQFV